MISVITIQQKAEWQNAISGACSYDYYHTWYYNKISGDGEPFLLKYTHGEEFIAIPLLRRSIPKSRLADITSVYGYTGPISSMPFEKIPGEIKDNFKTEFLTFLKENNYISVFSRLNPFLNQLSLMNSFSGIHDTGKIVVMNLRESVEQQRAKYESGLVRKIEKLRKMGFYVKEAKTSADIKAFVNIYTENMLSVGAMDYYMFSEEYFKDMLLSPEFDCRLMLVYHGDIPVCGATIVCTHQIMQSHLLGTLNSYKKYSPAKLITDEISILGRKLGMHYFNLGGGYGFKQDSLYGFKTAFSDLSMDFKSWRYIADPKVYRELILEANIDPDSDVDFFPLYRYKAVEENAVT